MPEPTSYHSAGRLIRQALKDAGRLQTGDDPSAEVLSDALGRLADLIFAWQTQGLKLWLNSIQQVTLAEGVSTYVLGPGGAITAQKPARIVGGWYVRNTGERYPLNPISWDEYHNLGSHTTKGAVTSYFVDKQRMDLVVKFWLTPDAAAASHGKVELLLQRQTTAPISLTEEILFPPEWYLALRWGLADELATGQPETISMRCERKAGQYREALEDWDVEDAATRFSPAAFGSASRFR